MSAKSWLMPILPMIIGLAFTSITFVTGEEINETHIQLLDYLLILTLGTGSIGVANKGYQRYTEYKKART